MTSTEPALGWRIWRVVGDRLHAVVWGTPWEPRARFEAVCRAEPSLFWADERFPAAHASPGRECDCGVYAFADRADAELLAREKVDGDVIALGRVSLWGRVLEGDRGWRGRYAYPYDLILLGGTEELARRLRALYAVDVECGPAVRPLHVGAG